jgi:hypothetical protein
MKKFLRGDAFIASLLALCAFLIYYSTLSQTVQFEDAGEIATSVYTLGVLHPTGYPLFTGLGYAFSHLPLGGSVIWRLNLLMALLAAVSVFCFYNLFVFLFSARTRAALQSKAGSPPSPESVIETAADRLRIRFTAACAVLLLAFSKTVWNEAVSVEVYTLHVLFVSVLCWIFLKALVAFAERRDRNFAQTWQVLALTFGLSFAHHMMTVLLVPAFLYLVFAVMGWNRTTGLTIAKGIPLFLLGLGAYLYLPLRAAQAPLMNWGDPSTIEGLWRHLNGRSFQYQMFASVDGALHKLGAFFAEFPLQFGYAPVALMIAGFVVLAYRSRRLFVFTGLLFLTCVLYTINYGFDDPNYYVNAYIALVMVGGFAVDSALRVSAGVLRPFLYAGMAVLAACPLVLNYRTVDQSRNFAVEDYARNVLASVSPNATILTMDWDYFYPVTYYLQIVEGVRPDVTVISGALLKFPWYFDYLAKRYPETVSASYPAIVAFIEQAQALERSGSLVPADPETYDLRLMEVTRSLVWSRYPASPVYVLSNEIDPVAAPGSTLLPLGLVLQLSPDSAATPPSDLKLAFRPLLEGRSETEAIRDLYAYAYLNTGIYWARRGDHSAASRNTTKALALRPQLPEALELQRILDSH